MPLLGAANAPLHFEPLGAAQMPLQELLRAEQPVSVPISVLPAGGSGGAVVPVSVVASLSLWVAQPPQMQPLHDAAAEAPPGTAPAESQPAASSADLSPWQKKVSQVRTPDLHLRVRATVQRHF